jgi:hypothetical protein
VEYAEKKIIFEERMFRFVKNKMPRG